MTVLPRDSGYVRQRERLSSTWALAMVCLVAVALCLPALIARVSAERSMPTSDIAVVDSALVEWGDDPSVVQRLKVVGIDTVVLGMRYDDDDRPLGYDPARTKFLAQQGFRVILALPAETPKGAGWLAIEVARAIQLTKASAVMPLGPVPPNYTVTVHPDDEASSRMAGLPRVPLTEQVVLSDLIDSSGMAHIASPGQVIRAHIVGIGPSDALPELTTRVRRAEKERGVRLVVLRGPSPELRIPLDLDKTLALTESIELDLPDGIRPGEPSAMPAVEPGVLVRFATALAALLVIALAGVLVVPFELRLLSYLGLGASVVVGAMAVADSTVGIRLLALATGIAGATLAVALAIDGRRSLLSYGEGVLVAVSTGVVVAGLGTRSDFLVGLQPFLGVKALLLAPVILILALGWWRGRKADALRSSFAKIRPWHMLVGIVVVAVLGFYLIRSDNSGLAPGWELTMRDRLDELLYIRPRFKEAFLGLPALVLAGLWPGKLRWLFAVIAAVGTASVVDSFAHFHTPLLTSLLRTGYAAVLGLAIGGLIWLIVRAISRRSARTEGTR